MKKLLLGIENPLLGPLFKHISFSEKKIDFDFKKVIMDFFMLFLLRVENGYFQHFPTL